VLFIHIHPSEKNWARYEDDDGFRSKAIARGKSRSLMNDDIVGAKPKNYGSSNAIITHSFAGVSSGLKDKSKNAEAPWGSGGNFDSTSYGKKWLDKTEK
jgi:hypothetical protein